MNIKELLLEGCRICMPYKKDREELVGETKIYIFEGGCGCQSKLIVEGDYCNGYRKEFEVTELDEAIKYFSDHAFSQENLMYKRSPAMVMTLKAIPDIDLDEENDYQMIEKIRLRLISELSFFPQNNNK